jgi:hypothetical protein
VKFSEVRAKSFKKYCIWVMRCLSWGGRLNLIVATTRRKDSSLLPPLEKGVKAMSTMATKILAVNVLLILGVCVFAVTLAVSLVVLLSEPILSSEAVLKWLTTQPASSCGGSSS